MENGIYLVQFVVGASAGHGVAVIRDGRVQGGDSAYWWEGTLVTGGETFSGELAVSQHSGGVPSVFGSFDKFTLSLTGRRSGDAWQGKGTTPAAPGQTMQLNLRLLQEG